MGRSITAFPLGPSCRKLCASPRRCSSSGCSRPAGLRATSEIWGSLEFRDTESFSDGYQLTERLLERLDAEGLILPPAEQSHVSTLRHEWQIPMYNLDFRVIPVTMEELKALQERELWSLVGDRY